MSEDKLTVGFKETKEGLTFVFALVKGITSALKDDGKITVGDLPHFLPSLLSVKGALEGIDKVPVEFKLASQAEADELKVWIKKEFDIPDDKMEQFIEDAFAVLLDMWVFTSRYLISQTQEMNEPLPNGTEPIDEASSA